jgi:hydrogenase nickel incorporation protein HypA/HybF
MHELTVALSLLEGVENAANARGFERVSVVHVRVGALSGIAPDALSFSWNVATEQSVAAGSRLEIEHVPLEVFCERCAEVRAPYPGSGLLCPACGTAAPSIVHGRELQLVALEVPE